MTSKYAIYTRKGDENHPRHLPMRVPTPIHPIQGDGYLATLCHFISSLAKVFFFDDMSQCLPYYDNYVEKKLRVVKTVVILAMKNFYR